MEKERIWWKVTVTNVVTFDEVVVDLVLHTPAMHIKKRAEDDIKTIHDLVSPEPEKLK
jgi:ATP-binding protein involved in chromosome partitioning